MAYLRDQLEKFVRAKIEQEVKYLDYPALPFSFIIYNYLDTYDISIQVYPGQQLVYHSQVAVSNNRINMEPTRYNWDVIVL